MLEPYRVFLEERVAQLLLSMDHGSRVELLAFVRSLASDPFLEGDFVETDVTDRKINTQLVEDYAISFYADHAAREVKVLQILRADQ